MDDMLEDKRRSKGEATRMALLEAALVLFGERGFEGTSTRDIAGLAGCNQGLISFHFGGKEGLYDAARTVIFENLGSIVRPMTRRLEEALAAETDAAALCGMLQTEITAILTTFIRKQHHQSWCCGVRCMWATKKHAICIRPCSCPCWTSSAASWQRPVLQEKTAP